MNIIKSECFKQALRDQTPLGYSSYAVVKELTAQPEVLSERTLRFVISTEDKDRDDDRIKQNGWQLQHYVRNPVVLLNHRTEEPPIGKCTRLGIEKGQLKAVVEFIPFDIPVIGPLAEGVYRLCKGGFMSATSVGFKPIEWKWLEDDSDGIEYQSQELLEFSVVTVPSNPFALVEPQQAVTNTALNTLSLNKCRMRLLGLI